MATNKPRVAVIGGLTRATRDWERAGDELGVIVEHHDGNAHGARAATLGAVVRRADVVVTIMMPNSHNAVSIARQAAHAYGRVCLLVKRLRPDGLAIVVAEGLALARTREIVTSGAATPRALHTVHGPLPSGMARSAKLASRVRIPEGAATRVSEGSRRDR